MVKYLKYIVIVFGGIGIIVASFFVLQNKQDIARALSYREKIDYEYLKKTCKKNGDPNVFPCLKMEFQEYLKHVSLTGTSFGLKMVFNVLDEDRHNYQGELNGNELAFTYSLYHLEINNMALDNAYRNYLGFSFLYGGFISSLKQYYTKAFRFSQDIITGLEGAEGLSTIKGSSGYDKLHSNFQRIKKDYYRIKTEANQYLDMVWVRLNQQNKVMMEHKEN